jgi:hypothetical protein
MGLSVIAFVGPTSFMGQASGTSIILGGWDSFSHVSEASCTFMPSLGFSASSGHHCLLSIRSDIVRVILGFPCS